MDIQEAIGALVNGESLAEPQAFAVATAIMDGRATPAQIAALLVAMRMKGETVDEITGFVSAMREKAASLPIDGDSLVDTCGTGGDSRGTFNISTVSAFVAAGAGCKIAKHGNRSVSSRCGSSEVLEELGIDTEMAPAETARCIERFGIGFLSAPQYHKATRHAVGPRREIGVRSIFNIIGPLTHPGGARRQLLGVFDGNLTEPLAHVLLRLGSTHCMVVHGEDGLDEITLTAPTRVSELRDGQVRTYSISPTDLGFESVAPEALHGGDPRTNARIALEVLGGKPGPARNVVLVNAGAAVYVAGRANDVGEGIAAAVESIDTGKALEALENLRSQGRRSEP